MGARTLYPVPPCPCCNEESSYVRETGYTRSKQIARYRRCYFCDHSWWTIQPSEVSIDPSINRVVLPDKFYKRKHVPIRIESCTPSQSSSA